MARHRIEFAQTRHVLDGGLGSQLGTHELDVERDLLGLERGYDALSITRPELVESVHASFARSGATLLTTNTFQVLFHPRADSSWIHESVRLARSAAGSSARVLGSLGPGAPKQSIEKRRASDTFRQLVDAGCDGLLIETQMEWDVMIALAECARAVAPDAPLLLSLVADVHGALPACATRGEAELARFANDLGVDLLAVNCSTGTAPLRPALERLRDVWSGPLGAYPNAGVPEPDAGGALRYPLDATRFAEELAALQHEFSLALVGGCCGTTPEHIRKLALAVASA